VRPFSRKRFGQNFLEPAWVEKVIRAIDPQPDDVFLEIGPGRGALTRPLAARAKSVVAYEIDRDLAAALIASAPPNVTVVTGDFLNTANPKSLVPDPESLQANPKSLIPNPYRVAGNLPYNVASPILFKLVELHGAGVPLRDATVMLQREVADRLLAHPGTKDYGVLTVLIGHAAAAERLLALPPGAFRPAPKVHSSLIRLRFHAPDPPVHDAKTFAALVQAVFTRRRKTLANALRALESHKGSDPLHLLTIAGLDGTRRPETLSIAEFARLADVYSAKAR
jgi:16S rRNA (adenine1518-N6/adenine1519-N6)-dimethyltransferase